MVQLREEFRFPLEAIQAFFVSRELFGKNFDRDVPLELGVARSINLTHATRADGFDDFVVAELGAGGDGHGSQLSVGTRRFSSENQLSTT